MRNLLQRLLLAALAAGTLTAAGCTGTAAYSSRGYGHGYAAVRPPPQPVDVYYDHRPGYVYIQGRWVWNGYDYEWQPGHYTRARSGYVYHQGYWDNRGRDWVWIDGRWTRDRPGYVYSQGYWDRRGGRYVWVQGKWLRERPNRVYIDGHWANRGGRRVWVDGSWRDRDRYDRDRSRVRDHRRRR